MPKSEEESEQYTVENCALEAKFIRERQNNGKKSKKKTYVDFSGVDELDKKRSSEESGLNSEDNDG